MKRYNVAYKAPSLPGSDKPRWMNIGFATEQESGNITVTLSGMPFPDLWKDQTLWLFPQDKEYEPKKRQESRQRDAFRDDDRGSGFNPLEGGAEDDDDLPL